MVLGWTASTSPAPGTSAVTTCISFPPSRPYTSAAHTAVPPLVGRKSSVITSKLISDIHNNIDRRSRKALMLGRSTSVGATTRNTTTQQPKQTKTKPKNKHTKLNRFTTPRRIAGGKCAETCFNATSVLTFSDSAARAFFRVVFFSCFFFVLCCVL